MNRKIVKGIAAALMATSVVFMALVECNVIWANSMPTGWSGSACWEMEVVEEDCPIEVVSETLTIDVDEFPKDIYQTEQDYLNYSGKVTAEYTFYNPTDYAVEATLAFPFGSTPEYAYTELREESQLYTDDYQDAKKYDITVDGKVIDKDIRCTFDSMFCFGIEPVEDIPLDSYVEDEFFYPDMPVIKYTFKVSNVKKYGRVNGVFTFEYNSDETGILVDDYESLSHDCGKYELVKELENDETITMYIIGKELENPLDFKVSLSESTNRIIESAVIEETMDVISFKDLACMLYDSDSGIYEHDWYNAVVANLNYSSAIGETIFIKAHVDMTASLTRWYTYEITLEPGQSIVNTVSAPIYPTINDGYEPDVYEYIYLLSPASKWSSLGEFEVIINTPFYLTECSIDGFEKTNYGYRYEQLGLPDGELEFSLCEEEEPTIYGLRSIIWNRIITVSVIALALLPVIGILVVVIVIIKDKRKRSRSNQ